jgi:hypothetical protein
MEKRLFEYVDGVTKKIVPPLPFEVIQNLFGWISTNTDIPTTSSSKSKHILNTKNIVGGAANKGAGVVEHDGSDNDDDEENAAFEPTRTDENDIFNEKKRTISVSCMQGYKSALKWCYSEAGVLFDPEADAWLDKFIQGYKKIVAEKKMIGVMSAKEGRQPVSFSGFCFLCHILMTLKPRGNKYPYKVAIFGWCFETLCWNIIGR